jgi:hypothetical protein
LLSAAGAGDYYRRLSLLVVGHLRRRLLSSATLLAAGDRHRRLLSAELVGDRHRRLLSAELVGDRPRRLSLLAALSAAGDTQRSSMDHSG